MELSGVTTEFELERGIKLVAANAERAARKARLLEDAEDEKRTLEVVHNLDSVMTVEEMTAWVDFYSDSFAWLIEIAGQQECFMEVSVAKFDKADPEYHSAVLLNSGRAIARLSHPRRGPGRGPREYETVVRYKPNSGRANLMDYPSLAYERFTPDQDLANVENGFTSQKRAQESLILQFYGAHRTLEMLWGAMNDSELNPSMAAKIEVLRQANAA